MNTFSYVPLASISLDELAINLPREALENINTKSTIAMLRVSKSLCTEKVIGCGRRRKKRATRAARMWVKS